MNRYRVWILVMATGMVPAFGYHKMCYVRPQYGCKGEIQCLTSKYFVCRSCKSSGDIEIESSNGRRVCYVNLSATDKARTRSFLDRYDGNTQIADESIERQLQKHRSHLKAVGLLLRDFKLNNKNVTVQQVRDAVAMAKSPVAQGKK